MQDETKQELEEVAERAEVDFDTVHSKYDKAFDKVERAYQGGEDQSVIESHAVKIVRNDLLNIGGGSGYGGGEAETLPVLSLGSIYREKDYFVTDGDGLVGLGIINPPEDPAGLSTFVIDSQHGVDLELAAEAFDPLTTMRAHVSRRQIGTRDGENKIRKGGSPTYLCNSTEKSKFEIVEPDDVDDSDPISQLPGDREAKREMIHENFITDADEVTLQNVPDHRSSLNSAGFETAFGIDVKRFRGQVIDVYSDEDSGFGTMTLLDDTVSDGDEVPEDLISDQQRNPGLQVIIDPRHLQYGENSLLDVYGFIEQHNESGQYRMMGFGIIPIVEFEREFDGGETTDDDHDEKTI